MFPTAAVNYKMMIHFTLQPGQAHFFTSKSALNNTTQYTYTLGHGGTTN